MTDPPFFAAIRGRSRIGTQHAPSADMVCMRSIGGVVLAVALFGSGANPWSVHAASPNVRSDARDIVVLGTSPERAAAIASHAVATRRGIHRMLLGPESPRGWVPPCEIHIHADPAAFARAVAGAPRTATGATSIEFLGDVVRLRRIDVVDAANGGIPGALDHELVHCVLADRFPYGPPPRWADEGLATLFDSPAKQRGHDADYQAAAVRGQAWPLVNLMALDAEPAEPARQRVFYGQSAAVVRWLLTREDGPTFLRFLDTAATNGTTNALRTHYLIDSLSALEREWQADPAALPAGPEPQPLLGRHEPRPGAAD